MKTETIEKILNFLQNNEGKKLPKRWFDSLEILETIQELENHPDGTQYRYKGHVYLPDQKNLTKLPNDLYVDGDLILKGCTGLKKLPDILYVGLELTVRRCRQLTKLPDNLYVGSYLDLQNSGIANIPDNLYVEGDMYIYGTPLADNYTDEEIRQIVASTGGRIKGQIIR
jgi:hypothetical protein